MEVTADHTILVVDDESGARDGISQALKSAGYVVAHCNDGAQAISWLRAHPAPSVLIGDVHMPGIDGFELRQRACELCADLAVLLITGDPDVGSNGSSRREPVGLLRKPFTRAELLDTVGKLIS